MSVYDEGHPRGLWRLGRSEDLILSFDGKVCRVNVKAMSKKDHIKYSGDLSNTSTHLKFAPVHPISHLNRLPIQPRQWMLVSALLEEPLPKLETLGHQRSCPRCARYITTRRPSGSLKPLSSRVYGVTNMFIADKSAHA